MKHGVVKTDLRNAMSLARSKGFTQTAWPLRIHTVLALQWGKEREGNLGEEENALYFYFFYKNIPVYNMFHILDSQ